MPPDVTQPQPPAPAEVPRKPEPQAPAVAAPASVPEPAPDPVPNPAPPPAPASVTPPTGLTKRETSRLHRLLVVGGTLLALFIIWEVFTAYVVYTDDAYVRSDLVALAPEITGRIIAVHVVDNQTVKKGDKLVTIDPVPFQLVVNQTKAQIEQAKALLKSSQEELSTAQAALAASTSANVYAAQEQARYADLARNEYAPRAELDRANDELRRSQAEMTISQIAISKAQTGIVAHQAALEVAIAENATAQWKLDRTQVFAPVNGTITNLTLQPGDTANIDVPMIGIVDADAWRIMANYKQYYIRDFKVGQTAWVWLDSEPWRWHRAKITGIARGISRNPGPDMLLPYVAPTTDWIRLQRRIPVTIVLVDKPDEFKLYMGADARTVIFP
ncbi:HlyD family secretion protein [Reyranella sp.]|uniref:HlyD family secretion protein n=1 Tax=Reyranella sp. TaxID=1929291 RepID=UPI0011F60B22|nr:HlyD family secretion protein [Reyranella sp.]TAJ83231.1 MAG: HlyD family secretion protein [Reyranella sp.]